MPRFAHKRVGYLAANQCFTEDTEVVLLCTNHLQKEFKSQNPVRGDGGWGLGVEAPSAASLRAVVRVRGFCRTSIYSPFYDALG